MTGPNDPHQQGGAGQWGAPEGQWQGAPPVHDYPGYPQSGYTDDSIGRLYDGVPQGYAVPPMYPGLPGQDPGAPQKQPKPWILITSISGAVVVVLAVVLVLILNRNSDPRQSAASPSTTTVSYAPPELPTISGAPTYRTPTAQPPGAPMPLPSQAPAPTGPPKAPGQWLAVGECLAFTQSPPNYLGLPCTDPKAAWRVFEVVPGGKCKQSYTGFTAGDFSYCVAPQLRIGSCYQTAVVMGSTVFIAADSCQAPKAFMVLFVIPGTTDSLAQCKPKPGVKHAYSFPDPPMSICTGEYAP